MFIYMFFLYIYMYIYTPIISYDEYPLTICSFYPWLAGQKQFASQPMELEDWANKLDWASARASEWDGYSYGHGYYPLVI